MAKETKAALQRTNLDVIADRGYFSSEEILECDEAGITVTLPKPMTSNPRRFTTIRRAELMPSATVLTRANDQAIRRALEQAGVEFIDAEGGGPGVRLRVPPAEK